MDVVSAKPPRKQDPRAPESPAGLDIYAIAALLWLRKWWILSATAALVAAGTAYALLSAPYYHADAILAPKQQQGAGGGGLLSQLSGMGGYLASQLGGNANMARLEILLKSDELALAVATEGGYVPELFPKRWDDSAKGWRKGSQPPNEGEIVEVIHGGMLEVASNVEKSTITIGINAARPELAARMAETFLRILNKRIRMDIRAESDSNRKYLEGQLGSSYDPMIREKIQNLIAAEIEKGMIMGSNTFDVLTHPRIPTEKAGPNRKAIVILSFLLGLFGSVFLVLLASVRSIVAQGIRMAFRRIARNGQEAALAGHPHSGKEH